MDCEKFEQAMMDELYGELDELTSAAAKRHVANCARCAAKLDGLRATRRVATLTTLEPPAELEERILTAARDMYKVVPLRRRMGNLVSVAGRWAMQPQAAVAVVFFVMLGGSVLLLRPTRAAKSDSAAGASPPVTVTERGAPAPEALQAGSGMRAGELDVTASRSAQIAEKPEARAKAAGSLGSALSSDPASNLARGVALGAAAPAAAGAGRDAVTAGDDARSRPSDTLAVARRVRDAKGCRAALQPFDVAINSGRGTPAGWDALLEGGLCRRNVGDLQTARVYLSQLLNVDSHKDRAREELERLDQQIAQAQGGSGPASVHASPKRPAAMPAAAPPAQAADSATGY